MKLDRNFRRPLIWGLGLCAGFLNGLFGSGGGMVTVPMLKKAGLSAGEAHSTSISIIFPLAVVSGFLYLQAGAFVPGDALPFLAGGLPGAIFGAWLLPRLKAVWLRKLFAVLILVSAVRLLL